MSVAFACVACVYIICTRVRACVCAYSQYTRIRAESIPQQFYGSFNSNDNEGLRKSLLPVAGRAREKATARATHAHRKQKSRAQTTHARHTHSVMEGVCGRSRSGLQIEREREVAYDGSEITYMGIISFPAARRKTGTFDPLRLIPHRTWPLGHAHVHSRADANRLMPTHTTAQGMEIEMNPTRPIWSAAALRPLRYFGWHKTVYRT